MGAHHWPDGRIPVLLSAHDNDLLRADAAALVAYLDGEPDVAALAAHLVRTRRIRRHRRVIRAADTGELADGLRAVAEGRDHGRVAASARGTATRTAFVFPGQGGQYPGMGADAYRGVPAYRAQADRCAAAFVAAGHPSPQHYLTTTADPDLFTEIEVQGAQFTHAVALAAAWRSCGVVPDLTVGHSLGEVAAAYLAETITLDHAVAVLGARAGVVDLLPGDYAVAARGIPAAAAEELIAATPGWVELSVINASASVAVSGDRAAVAAAVSTVKGRGQLAREITVNFPVHTSVLDPLRSHVEEALPDSQFAESPVQFIGSVTGDVVAAGTEFTDYWYHNLRSTVRFDRAADAAIRCGVTVFVEMSNHPSLLHALEDRIEHAGPEAGAALLVGSGLRGEPTAERLAASIAAVAVSDPGFRWRDTVTGHEQKSPRAVPNAPMRATHMWARPEPLPPRRPVTIAAERWLPTRVPVPTVVRRVAVVQLGDPGALTGRLTAALDAHPGALAVTPAEADLIIAVAPELAEENPVDSLAVAVSHGVLSPLGRIGPECRDVWLLTAGGEQIGTAGPGPRPTQAALAAMYRSIAFDHPDQTFHHLDLPVADAGSWTVAVDVLLAGNGEVAMRDNAMLYRRELHDVLHDTATVTAPPWSLPDVLDNVVITGGAGAIGLHYARYFAAHGATRIVLLSRRSADPATLAELTHRHGVEIFSPRCDITDRAQLTAVAAEFAGDGASLLLHAAGTAAWDEQLTAATISATSAAKVTGLTVVSDVWPLRDDARIMLCSSVIGVWGGKATSAYAAANRMLDAHAVRMREQGRRCVSVKFGLWQHSGIVDDAEAARVERAGLLAMAPELAIEASLYDHPVDPLIFDADPERLARFLGTQEPAQPAPAAASRPDDSGDPADVVRSELAAVLDIADAAALDLDASLFDLGVDSLLALDLRKRMKRRTGQTVPLAILLGGITGSELIDTLAHAAPHTGTEEAKVEFSRD
jgi:mycobactin polyketide synthetase MbtD